MRTLVYVMCLSGSLVTQAVGVPFSTDELWYLNFVPNCFFSLVTLVMFFVVYESPQFIMEKEGNVEKVGSNLGYFEKKITSFQNFLAK